MKGIARVLLAVGAVAACEAPPENPEQALERTLIELREGIAQPIVQDPDARSEPGEGPSDTAQRTPGNVGPPGETPGPSPTFTPYELAPSIANRSEVQRALAIEYPSILRDAGVGGTTLVHMGISSAGLLENALVAETSGYPQLDQAALRVAEVFRFEPARNAGQTVPVWIQVPITFAPTVVNSGR